MKTKQPQRASQSLHHTYSYERLLRKHAHYPLKIESRTINTNQHKTQPKCSLKKTPPQFVPSYIAPLKMRTAN